MRLRTKLMLALASLIVVPILMIVIAILLIRYDIIHIEALQNIDLSTLQLIADGKTSEELLLVPITLLSLFFVGMLAMIILVSKIISDFVLLPLKELNYASERMSQGDLDFKIKYNKDNEFGMLCREFDNMKDNLRVTLHKQSIYENSRKELIASITHDLKTPLTSIVGYVEGLQDGVVTNPDTVQNYLNVIHDKSMRLDHLIDDLFTFTQLELEKFTVNVAKTDMAPMLSEYAHTKIREFQSKDLAFIVTEPLAEGHLMVDDFRIGQVLENLISNAEKFSTNFIKLYTDTDNVFYNIYIEDDGCGIHQDDLPFIFDYFYQADKARETKRKGTGLGLAICKQLIEAHKGRIYVTSKLDKGTIFKISLKK